ncbi:hypothetical protein OSB04_017302 [Centaurea solstitialis]|uniref:Transposase MuDR plant domain-containing protein n=1 Tax=Centaurea solstitialis TaxID=347529 RepID=A0AA38TKR0_9ASTR|nr:hypothetical protein OSB04_017302 [Centaurea solstitialis]
MNVSLVVEINHTPFCYAWKSSIRLEMKNDLTIVKLKKSNGVDENFKDNVIMEVQKRDVVSTTRGTSVTDGCDDVESSLPDVNDGYDDIESSLPNVNDGCDDTKSNPLSPPKKEGLQSQEFENKEEVKVMLNDIALKACFEMVVKKSTKSLYVTKCIDSTCKCAVRTTKIMHSKRFSIRTYCNIHTCSLINQKRKNRQASASLVGRMVKPQFEGQKEIPNPKTIMTMMKNNNVPISYWKAWKGKQRAQDLIKGSPKESFTCLPSYFYMVQKMNPGTVTYIEVDESGKFKYAFIAYGACIRGFLCMRKVIAVDGTWLKSKYKDGNFHQYPLAWAVVDAENDASWSLYPMKKSWLSSQTDTKHHQWTRVRVQGVVQSFERTTNAYKVSTFTRRYNELKNRFPGAIKYLEEYLDVKQWARSHFPSSRYNIMTTNGAESISSVLRDAREYPITALLEAI